MQVKIGEVSQTSAVQYTSVYADEGDIFIDDRGAVDLFMLLEVAFYPKDSGRIGLLPDGASDSVEIRGDGMVNVHTATVSAATGGGSQIVGEMEIAPGQSPGLLAATGDFLLDPGSSFTMELGGTAQGTNYDVFDLTGALSLDGVALNLWLVSGFASNVAPTDVFTVIQTTAAITGAFLGAPNGSRLNTADGLGSFVVNYGAGSAYAPSAVVLSDFLAATNPPPQLLAPGFGAGGAFQFNLTGIPGQNFVIEATEDLGLPSWTPIATNPIPPSGLLPVQDSEAAAHDQRFYRAHEQ